MPWFQAWSALQPGYGWILFAVFVIVVLHHLADGRVVWSFVTGAIGSFLLGWLAQTLGLGWFAHEIFGGYLQAGAVYVAIGIFWLVVEVGRDMITEVNPRYHEFKTKWSADLLVTDPNAEHESPDDLLAQLKSEITRHNFNNLSNPIIYPREYFRSANRRQWFILWFTLWPIFFVDTVLRVAVLNPIELLGVPLSYGVVRIVQGIFVPPDVDRLEFTSDSTTDERTNA